MRKNERDSASATALRLLSHQDAATTNDPFSFSLVYIYTFVFLFLTMLPVNRNKRSSYFFPACKHNKMKAIKKKDKKRRNVLFFKNRSTTSAVAKARDLSCNDRTFAVLSAHVTLRTSHGLMLVPTSRYTPFCFPFLFLLKKTSSSKNRKSSLSIHAMQHAYKKKEKEASTLITACYAAHAMPTPSTPTVLDPVHIAALAPVRRPAAHPSAAASPPTAECLCVV